MKLSRKFWMVMFLAVCLVIIQYHLTSSWLVAPASASNNVVNIVEPVGSEEMLRSAVERLQVDSAVTASVGEKVIKELVMQLGRELGIGGCGEVSAPAIPSKPTYPSPTLYIITPTYRRPEQIPELTRMAQTLMHVQNIHWLVIEDANTTTKLVTELLKRTGIPFEHLVAPMPEEYKKRRGPKPRGVSNRNRGLEWIRANATKGVLYFADDDNTYDILLFDEIRTTKRVAMWPVGLCTKFGLSTPIVQDGKFTGFYDGWVAGRKFPIDMAGFAVNVEFLLKRPKASMPYKAGFEEDGFLKSLAPFEPHEIELKANNCTKVM
ncbi:galactosylgalactosylxylosylprotein 3-beta-glucuronosyltransferase P isoform X2 [Anabrus simplex]|uniref:galactosylgalactosylxylosylprotein 3-beta-glucuronosyltransferase P isoform X2 n=1 Tax=Anabrus simplex TaxID=316456 RepID=UPI0034DD84CD